MIVVPKRFSELETIQLHKVKLIFVHRLQVEIMGMDGMGNGSNAIITTITTIYKQKCI